MASPSPPRAEMQDLLIEANKTDLVVGEQWAVVDAKWFAAFLAHSGMNPRLQKVEGAPERESPGPIYNDELKSKEEGEFSEQDMDKDKQERRDFELVHINVYNLLKQWFGGGPDFVRDVIEIKSSYSRNSEKRINIHPVHMTVVEADPDTGAESGARTVHRLHADSKMKVFFNKLLKENDGDGGAEEAATPAAADDNNDEDDWKTVGRTDDSDSDLDDDAKDESVRLWYKPKPEEEIATGESADDAVIAAAGPRDPPSKSGRVENLDGWKLFTKEHLDMDSDVFLYQQVPTLLLERRRADGTWPRFIRPWNDFYVGQVVDAKDTENKWYFADVLEVDQATDMIKVHYHGWQSKWDKQLDATDPDKVLKKGTKAVGGKDTRKQQKSDGKGVTRRSAGSRVTDYYSSSYRTSSYGGYSGSTNGYRSSYSYNSNQEGEPAVRGAVGLRNLGNTCFMNSTLQCLSHTTPLRDFVLSNKFEGSINRTNALGWKGRIADEYGGLVRDLWCNKYTVVAPSKFKEVLGQFQPRFSGYQQQDSSELLHALLDGLHEDLNQVQVKPATQTVEGNGNDKETAQKAWDTHLLRNQSKVVDVFMGQLKSTVDCPVCPRVSVTFDPYMVLSVPLPVVSDKVVEVFMLYQDSSKPVERISVQVSKVAFMHELKAALAKMVGIPETRMIVADVWSKKVYRFVDEMAVSRLLKTDKVWVFEMPEADAAGTPLVPGDWLPAQIVQQVKSEQYGRTVAKAAGTPLVMPLHLSAERPVTHAQVLKTIRAMVEPSIKPGMAGKYTVRVLDAGAKNEGCLLEDSDKVLEVPLKGNYNSYYSSNDPKTLDVSFAVQWDGEDDFGFDMAKYEESAFVDHVAAGAGEEGGKKKKGVVELSDCIEMFTVKETLSVQDAWYCNQCKEFRQATKNIDLWSLPEVLIVHLKRFHYTRMSRDKISTFVDFPFEGLSLKNACVNPEESDALYDLFAVSNHSGGMGGGHYTAYCMNSENGKWYMHNDSSTSEVNRSEVKSAEAYVLFYRKRPQGKGEGDAVKQKL